MRMEFYGSQEPLKVKPKNALLDLILWQATIVFQYCGCIFASTALSMMPPTAGSPTPTIIRDLQDTSISPTPNRLDSKRFFQSTNDALTINVTMKPGSTMRVIRPTYNLPAIAEMHAEWCRLRCAR